MGGDWFLVLDLAGIVRPGVLGIFWFWVVWVGFSCARCCYVSLLFCSRLAAGSGRLWRACFVVGLGDFV